MIKISMFLYIRYIKVFSTYIMIKMIQIMDESKNIVKKFIKGKKSEPIFKEIIPDITDDRNRRCWEDFVRRHKSGHK